MAILNWDGLSHYDFKMKAKITEWLNGKAEKVHTHTKSEVGLDQVDNTSDADKPISTAQKKKFDAIDTAIAGKSSTGHKHTKSDITDFPALGTASSKDVAATGNASSTQVVMGNDSRLTDARKASDVQAWAKAENKPSYTKLEVGLGNVDNTSDTNKPVSTAQQTAIDTAYANANKYTDKKVADLIGSAPETMDTLEEVAAAIQENKNVEKALNEAIGKKANQTELDTHTGNSTIHITTSERTKWNAAKTHADSIHARTDATKVEKSTTNGNIKINGTETTVYTHPSSHSIAEVSGLQTALDGKGTYSKPSGGIPKSDLASAVQTSLGKADTALQSHQDISGKVDNTRAGINSAINKLEDGTQTPQDGDLFISQYVGGGTTNTTYIRRPINTLWTYIKGKADKVYSALGHKHTKSEITDFPTSMPASDVSAWAKAKTKPTYSASEVGLGNVDNTADSTKSVKYATSAGSAGWATKATAIVDYAQTSKNIQIGYNGNGIKGDEIKFIAGYTAGNGSDVTVKIKDVSKDALKSWLGLGSLAYSSATIPTIPTSLPANGGNSTTVNGHTVNADVPSGAKFTDTHTDPVLTKTASTTVGAMWYE